MLISNSNRKGRKLYVVRREDSITKRRVDNGVGSRNAEEDLGEEGDSIIRLSYDTMNVRLSISA